jgi:alkanesulfonate monooxygenase SsuD/methylene tetrahydromethanopterin reductase-like flavin-dependent oxidoreductase (luciferase family)
MTRPRVGVSVHDNLLSVGHYERLRLLDAVVDAGLDHVTAGDHVSFHGGSGFDGLLTATAVLATHPNLDVLVGVYQLALRHPMVVARQLASVAQLAPGRLTFGVGVGGEDRSEPANCGVDPATRGRRTDEALDVLRRLATGDAIDHDGEFFELKEAAVLPAPAPAVPLVIGGAGDVAVRRIAERGDGWLGLFCTPRRFTETRQRIVDAAAAVDRSPDWFGVTVWCGLGGSEATARALLGAEMEQLYRLPPDRFAHLTGAGTAEQVAEYLSTFVDAGAQHVTIVPVARTSEEGVELAGHVRELLVGGNR